MHRLNLRTAKLAIAFGVLATLGACADSSTVAPASQVPVFRAPANFLQVGSSIVFRVDNANGITQEIGEHILHMQPGAICDLESSYGPATWDADCSALRGSVTITATVFAGPNGEPYIDFQPAMRFSPNKQAYLFLRADASNGDTQMQRLLINYCNDQGYCVDESLTDASLTPFRLDEYGIVGRRVKHFSGYVVAFECVEGEVCPPADNGSMRKSGYMVASGEDVIEALKNNGTFDRYKDQ
jgi:hypothetical protein